MIGFPLLIIPFAIYNMIAFLTPGFDWASTPYTFPLNSGVQWGPSFADAFLEWLKAFTMPTLVVCGSEDDDNGSAEELASALPRAVYREVPGTHMSSVTRPELGDAIADFLAQ